MIAFIVGTTAELIKIAPVYHELVARGRSAEIWYTGQHVNELPGVLGDLDLPAPAIWLVPERGAKNLARTAQVPGWVLRLFRTVLSQRSELRARLRSDSGTPIVLVHGDTFTTLFGSIIGRILRAKVGHIEAGLRSGHLLHPFPEEINRKVTARLAYMHFAPGEIEARNLSRRRRVVVTGGNTVIDSVRLALSKRAENPVAGLPDQYGVATLHRFELVRDKQMYESALRVLKDASKRMPIVYFAGESEKARLAEYGLESIFDEQFLLRDKLRYVEFLPVLSGARFVVTDSGGVQEECAHLGIPCAVHRVKTERHQGIGHNVMLTGMDTDRLANFLENVDDYRSRDTADAARPSAVIVDVLEKLA
ncbi:UDP-N-acetylglucosamine 2-epimerase (non-hydrolysing) [Sanguibacter gelidistatuariae]|uniref:UDP-N-acetylglucosamine 2-epimerase (Non-hydrolysing) n=1 Tax=Sanguibacter gelidistatuariae TaxID=1814289 RepID=A0A1G6XYU7_9MICO|nr:UDP-N-acetylglucosamine 2-epimerase [Sanguibacter gelidistatuariae]SDD82556.1 UDP-N-acetylglucosamine 2-epimerase (non-hydrolysing) [Sanguibacter gelidistatuariae]